jgi:hypothetical protein
MKKHALAKRRPETNLPGILYYNLFRGILNIACIAPHNQLFLPLILSQPNKDSEAVTVKNAFYAQPAD